MHLYQLASFHILIVFYWKKHNYRVELLMDVILIWTESEIASYYHHHIILIANISNIQLIFIISIFINEYHPKQHVNKILALAWWSSWGRGHRCRATSSRDGRGAPTAPGRPRRRHAKFGGWFSGCFWWIFGDLEWIWTLWILDVSWIFTGCSMMFLDFWVVFNDLKWFFD